MGHEILNKIKDFIDGNKRISNQAYHLLQCLEEKTCTIDETFHEKLDSLINFTVSTASCLKSLITSSSTSSRDISSLSSKTKPSKRTHSDAKKFNIIDFKRKPGSSSGARKLKKKRSEVTQKITNAFLEDPDAAVDTAVEITSRKRSRSKSAKSANDKNTKQKSQSTTQSSLTTASSSSFNISC